MKSIELKERITKSEEKINKIMSTIEKHKNLANKKLSIIYSNGWSLNRYDYTGNNYNEEAYWTICEYEDKLESIKESYKKLEKAKITLNNWIEKYNKQLSLENMITNTIPEIFIQCRNDLSAEWTKSDMNRKNYMIEQKKNLSYEEFRKLYSYTEEENLYKTEDEFYKINLKKSELFIIDLYNRVKEITGEVTDWGNIHYQGKALNGWVAGINGKAKVETILAGGYNIQKLHMRVLVNKL